MEAFLPEIPKCEKWIPPMNGKGRFCAKFVLSYLNEKATAEARMVPGVGALRLVPPNPSVEGAERLR